MVPDFNDSNPPAPEAAPADVWDDEVKAAPDPAAPGTILPPIRIRSDTTTGPDGGLRIGATNPFPHDNTAEHRLEVQEIVGSVVRLAPDIPDVPKVPRHVTFHERPEIIEEDPNRRGEGREWGNPRQYPLRWVVGTTVGIIGVVVLAMMMLQRVNQSNAASTAPGQTNLVVDRTDDIKGSEALDQMLSRQPEAERIFTSFVSARIVDDLLLYVRNPETVAPLIRAKPLPPPLSKSWRPDDSSTWNVFETSGRLCATLEGPLPDYSRFHAYFTLTESHLDLDWKATTGYGTATFDELERSQGDPSEIRATIMPSNFHTTTFPEKEFQSYQLVSPDNEKAIWCYARRGELTEAALGRLFRGGEIVKTDPEPRRVTLKLEKAPEGALPNQWLIKELLHKDWITP